MREYTGWLFDLYAHATRGILVWIVGEDGKPRSFRQQFPVTFYANGPVHRLRQLWKFLKGGPVTLSYTQREDLYEGTKNVVAVGIINPISHQELFREIHDRFPDLIYYDVDIPLLSRYAAEFGVFPLAYCRVKVEKGWDVASITPLDTPWELDPKLPDLRVLHLKPDVNPSHAEPKTLFVDFDRFKYRLSFGDPRRLLSCLNSVLRQYDPDVILTSYGDTCLFNLFEEMSRKTGIPFNPNRDPLQAVRRKKEISFHNYGQAHYRGEQVHLFGRWHIDEQNCMTFGDYGLMGAIEQARVTSLPVQEMARRSPGAGVAAMQALAALQRNVLVPYERQKGEAPKTYDQLVAADRGGIILEPLPGVFPHVAIIDFVSMYPSIMAKYNISPETVCVEEADAWEIPELGIKVSSREGLVSATLRPLADKRAALKRLLKTMPKSDGRYQRYKAASDGLKWLGVVSNGRLGFAMATFGRINAHEALSFLARKMILCAKEIVENHGFTVLHIYVDSLFICKTGAVKEEDFLFLLDEIERETDLPIEVEAVYSWMAFLSSKRNPNLSVPNLFFGLGADGEYKIRGLALRREDTPLFIAHAQLEILQMLAKEKKPGRLARLLPDILRMVWEKFDALNDARIPLTELLITQTLSRELFEYRVPSPVARAAIQLQNSGRNIRMGQRIPFLHTKTPRGVCAWGLPGSTDPALIDIPKYKELLFRAVHEVVQPLGVPRDVLRNWIFSRAGYLAAPGLPGSHDSTRLALPLFNHLKYLHVDNL